jgi:hypothetical protein
VRDRAEGGKREKEGETRNKKEKKRKNGKREEKRRKRRKKERERKRERESERFARRRSRRRPRLHAHSRWSGVARRSAVRDARNREKRGTRQRLIRRSDGTVPGKRARGLGWFELNDKKIILKEYFSV